ncbi:hypothetical protein MNEG_12361, partial [Monoraphidium neglectum]
MRAPLAAACAPSQQRRLWLTSCAVSAPSRPAASGSGGGGDGGIDAGAATRPAAPHPTPSQHGLRWPPPLAVHEHGAHASGGNGGGSGQEGSSSRKRQFLPGLLMRAISQASTPASLGKLLQSRGDQFDAGHAAGFIAACGRARARLAVATAEATGAAAAEGAHAGQAEAGLRPEEPPGGQGSPQAAGASASASQRRRSERWRRRQQALRDPARLEAMAQQLSGLRQPVLQLVSRHAASMKPKDLAAALGGLAALGWGERRA